MKPFSKPLIFGIGCYLAFMLVLFPANLANQLIGPLKGVSFNGVSGTIFSGQAQSVQYNGQSFNQVRWSFLPFGLFMGRLGIELKYKTPGEKKSNQVTAAIDFLGRYHASDSKILINAADVSPRGVNMTGKFELLIAEGVLDNEKGLKDFEGTLIWHKPAIKSQLGKVELSTLSIDVAGNSESGITGKIKERKKLLGLKGELKWLPDGKYTVDGSIDPKQDLNGDLAKIANIFAKPDENGVRNFHFEGQYQWPEQISPQKSADATGPPPGIKPKTGKK